MTWEERRRLVEECESSGRPIIAWLREKGIPYSTFANWRQAVREGIETKSSRPSAMWAELKPEETRQGVPPVSGAIRISRAGWTIEAKPGFDAGLLDDVLRAVGRVCC